MTNTQVKTSDTPFALMVSTRIPLKLSLIHLISSLLKKSIVVFQRYDEAVAQIRGGLLPDLVISDFRDDGDKAAEFISEARSVLSSAFVIAIVDAKEANAAVSALLAGAQDVVRFPFSLRELALRIRLGLGQFEDESYNIDYDDSVNWDTIEFVASQAHLTSVEAQIAGLLFGKNGEIISRNELSYAIDHRPWSYGDRKFDVHVAKIRKKLNSSFGTQIEVKTVRSVGYKLVLKDTELRVR